VPVRDRTRSVEETILNDQAGPLVLLEQREGVATVTLNRPRARNALSRALAAELRATLDGLAADDGLRAVVVTGEGERAFSAGADLTERQTMTPAERTAHTAEIFAAVEALAQIPVPTIAAIRGYALAGGAELVLACDLRVAADDAVFGFPEVKIGIFPGAGGVVRLPRLIGPSAARELLFTGRQVGAADAYRLGLIDYMVPEDEVLPTAHALAADIAANAPLAVRAVKRALRDAAGGGGGGGPPPPPGGSGRGAGAGGGPPPTSGYRDATVDQWSVRGTAGPTVKPSKRTRKPALSGEQHIGPTIAEGDSGR
jgi:enoyl-CoA hydratase